MRVAHIVIGVAALGCIAAAHADGFVLTRPLSSGGEMRLVEQTSECGGGPGAFIYRQGQRVDQTCNVVVTPKGATVRLPASGDRIFFPRDTLY